MRHRLRSHRWAEKSLNQGCVLGKGVIYEHLKQDLISLIMHVALTFSS